MKLSCAVGCIALVALGLSPAAWSDPDPERHTRTPTLQPDEGVGDAGSYRFSALEAESRRVQEALNRQIIELESPHWVCMLSLYPQSAKKPSDGCVLVGNARKAEELVDQRRGYVEFAVAASAVLLALLLGSLTLRYLWRRLARSAVHSVGAVAQQTSTVVKAGARMAGRASAVFTDKTSSLAQAFREGRESVKRARPD